MERYICIHGHFYQPPRENPSLEAVQLQDSAYPYHDWNERITVECYGPNGASRILDGEGRIVHITNSYSKMSFNFGPTLLSWMEQEAPEVYQTIIAADRESRVRFSGHGSAIAQAYNHMILPLANQRDKRTQVLWGIRDFEHRFGRFPEGMWLPETGVDIATLEALAECGIKFTILAPHQASRVRRMDEESWHDVAGGRIDPAMAYELELPSGRKINLFFYDGPISRAVAFDGLLNKGEFLAERLMGAFSESHSTPQLVHIATDGETYGHHHRHGDMALAFALHYIESNNLARITNYGEFLEKYPPSHQVEIFENTSWSCLHGVERWRSNCGCSSGWHADWNQSWRAPLRTALDWLRDNLNSSYDDLARQLLRDPWAARDEYITVVLNRSSDNVDKFLARHAARTLDEAETVKALKLLEAQRNAMLMYTSCGWFFDEISGIETVQLLQYAGRVVQLAEDALDQPMEAQFLELLERAESNIAEHQNGRRIYEKWVKPGLADFRQVGAHYAFSSLFEDYRDEDRIYCYRVEREDYRLLSAGKVRLALGKAKISSEITRDSERLAFGVLHLGDHNISGGIREFGEEEPYEEIVEQISAEFARGDLVQLIRLVDNVFGSASYSLKLLFRDEQRRVLDTILDSTLKDTQSIYRQVYEHQAPIMQFLSELNAPLPKAWHAAAELVLNANIRNAFESENSDPEMVRALLDEAERWQVKLDGDSLGYVIRQSLEREAARLQANPQDLSVMQRIESVVDVVRALPFEADLWKLQNVFYEFMQGALAEWKEEKGRPVNAVDTAWLDAMIVFGEKLGIGMAELSEMRSEITRKTSTVMEIAAGIAAERRTPLATYRLQFNGGFSFQDAKNLVPYLYELGISDCYASPILKPRANSSHGYDICDHSELNPALGNEEDFTAFVAALRRQEMGLILDMVPNHMGIADAGNRWWMDVLENGPSSICASYFDIDWNPVKLELQNKVLLPILEDQYGKVLESGKLRLAYEDGAFYLYYYETRLPIAPRTYSPILSHQLGTLVHALGSANEHVRELESILTALSYLPERTETAPEKIQERNREKEIIKNRITALYQSSQYVRAAIDTAVQSFNGTVGDPRSFDLLHDLLDSQPYRPAYWRVAAEEINYRRFFDINDLAAIRTELPEVFQATHQLILRFLAEGKANGLRIDHPDGLWNPKEYFRWLQESYLVGRARMLLGEDISADAVSPWLESQLERRGPSASPWPLYVVAEKILSDKEQLPNDWIVDGTTGYDFLNSVNGLFVDGEAQRIFTRIYQQFTGAEIDYGNLTNSTRKMTMLVSQVSEINALAHRLERIAERNRLYRDFTLNSLTFAVREVIAALPTYRTYITGPMEGARTARQQDERSITVAVNEAKKRNPRTAATIFDFIRDTLLLRNIDDFAEDERQAVVDLVMKFQQVTSPVMAKGVEDTAFYVYNRLVSLNEVGGHPEDFGVSVQTFHERNIERLQQWPHSMLATSTHDTKRSEDVRARINVLSEIPDEWQAALARWNAINSSKKTQINGQLAPDLNDEYLLYQTLLGTWPNEPIDAGNLANYRERIAAYMQKATKEAKVHTSWVNPNEQYDAAVREFVERVLANQSNDPFIEDLLALERRVAYYGRFNALSQVLLKLTSPGVPDIYQGTELWDYSLVDPDNRRPVDYRRRRELLTELRSQADNSDGNNVALARQLTDASADGRIKLYMIYRALGFRRAHPELFSEGGYTALTARGAKKEHVCAFARTAGEKSALVVAPRLVVKLTGGTEQPPTGADIWRDTSVVLPEENAGHRYLNVFTGETLSVTKRDGQRYLKLGEILGAFPVALLQLLPD